MIANVKTMAYASASVGEVDDLVFLSRRMGAIIALIKTHVTRHETSAY